MTSSSRSNTPPAVRSQLAAVLADTTREVEDLREQLAQANKRAEYFQSILNADDRVRDAEKRVQMAERERDIELKKSAGVVEMWRQLRDCLEIVESQVRDAQAGFDRFIMGASHGDKRTWIQENGFNEYPRKRARPTVNTKYLPPYPAPSSARPQHSPGAESVGNMSVDEMLIEASSTQQQQRGLGQVLPQTPQSASTPIYHTSRYPESMYPAVSPSPLSATTPATPYPQTNSAGHRICRQCGIEGRYKDGRCVEKWGPGPCGPGTVCDRCRKKIKRLERRNTMEAQQNQLHPQHHAAARNLALLGQSKSLPSPLSRSTPLYTTQSPRIITTAEDEIETILPTPPLHPEPPATKTTTETSAEDDLEALISEQQQGQQAFNESSMRTETQTQSVMHTMEEDSDADGSAEEDLLEAVEASEGSVGMGGPIAQV